MHAASYGANYGGAGVNLETVMGSLTSLANDLALGCIGSSTKCTESLLDIMHRVDVHTRGTDPN